MIAVLKGPVVGGGLEFATAPTFGSLSGTAFFALPDGARGLFVGGGASVRVYRVVGVQR
ncbi:hypothetical protein [Streptomyces griseorubiginosus]|uniref:hypothetical protein n=1 Tax=Streptomyces griseorubiginosus TaxID=67304 RepID=UPI003663C495